MSIREKVRRLDAAPNPNPQPNPIEELVVRLVEATLLGYDERLREEFEQAAELGHVFEKCRDKATEDLREALDTYGLVVGYGRLLAACKELLSWWDADPSSSPMIPLHSIRARIRAAVTLCETSLVVDESDSGPVSPTDPTLPF